MRPYSEAFPLKVLVNNRAVGPLKGGALAAVTRVTEPLKEEDSVEP